MRLASLRGPAMRKQWATVHMLPNQIFGFQFRYQVNRFVQRRADLATRVSQ
jgi:hypothetical protein